MNQNQWAIFVEGVDDKKFVKSLLQHLGVTDFTVSKIGGSVDHLGRVANNIHRMHDTYRHVAMILDADQDIANRRQEVTKQIEKLSLPLDQEHVFLLPDNRRPGSLETLLEELAVSDHRAIFDYLDNYGVCLRKASEHYLPPGGKGRIYAYCEALEVEPRGAHRCYLDGKLWDLKIPEAEPLLAFLRSLPT